MIASFQSLQMLYDELIGSPAVPFVDVSSKKKITGVYIAYSVDGAVLYIGSTNNFHVRFGTDMKHESTHTLIRKLLKDGSHADRSFARTFLIDSCHYRICICSNKREAEALEHFTIWMLNPKYNK